MKVKATLQSNQLNFLGFLLPRPLKSQYNRYLPEDKTQTSLQNWAIFEERYPIHLEICINFGSLNNMIN